MAGTVEISLAKALKVKNRLAGLITSLDKNITNYNSVQEGTEQPDVREMYEWRKGVVSHLIRLKSAITLANAPIQSTIYEMAELKALVALLNSLSTKHGKFAEGYSTTPVSYVANLKLTDIMAEVRQLQSSLDRMQDQLDTFNQTTRIQVDQSTLAIADGKKPSMANETGTV